MLAAQIDAVLADFTRRRVPFSHRDVAERIPNMPSIALPIVRRYVYLRMQHVPSYRSSVAHFVGEGPTVLCLPREMTPAPQPQTEPLSAA